MDTPTKDRIAEFMEAAATARQQRIVAASTSKPEATQGAVFAAGMLETVKDAIDRAVANERERCALIVEQSEEGAFLEDIAAAIRGRK